MIKAIYTFIINTPRDKLLHIVIAASLVCLLKIFLSFVLVFLFSSLIFVGIKLYDAIIKKENPELKDIVADYIGFIIGIL